MSQTQFETLQSEIASLHTDFKNFMEMFSKALNLAIDDKIENAPCRQIEKMKELENRISKLEEINKIA